MTFTSIVCALTCVCACVLLHIHSLRSPLPGLLLVFLIHLKIFLYWKNQLGPIDAAKVFPGFFLFNIILFLHRSILRKEIKKLCSQISKSFPLVFLFLESFIHFSYNMEKRWLSVTPVNTNLRTPPPQALLRRHTEHFLVPYVNTSLHVNYFLLFNVMLLIS